jgi:alkylation response protein AidB-like acyl-CoA dehydrogenase
VTVSGTAEALELAQAFDAAVGALLSETTLLEAARTDQPLDEHLLAELDALGWVGLAVPEEQGGVGLDAVGCALLAATAGARLLPAAMRGEAFVLAPLLAACSDARLDELLTTTIRGAGVIGSSDDGTLEVPAYVSPGARILGVVTADSAFVVEFDEYASAIPVQALEAGQGAMRIRVSDAARFEVAVDGAVLAEIRSRLRLAMIAEAFGAGREALRRAVVYAGQREQFGRPIGAFQGVTHQLATATVALEAANAGIGRLAQPASAAEGDDLERALAHVVPAAARQACEAAIQVHGGMGFTWELGLHLFYRRSLSLQALLGGGHTTLLEAGRHYLATRVGGHGARAA